MRPASSTLVVASICMTLCCTPSFASEAVSFKDKTITMIISATAGAGSDLSARLFERFFSKYLQGAPATIASNVAGGHGIVAMNYLAQQAKPDGLTLVMGSDSEADPINYRTPQSKYDPTEFVIIGSVGLGDGVVMIRRDAEPRLLNKNASPVTIGSVGGLPRSGMSMGVWGIEYLGWNARWVVGYPGSSDLLLALENGEIDMTAFPKTYLADKLTDTTRYKVLYRQGLIANEAAGTRADLDNAPSFVDAMEGRITDPEVKQAYDYWRAGILFKWLALPPKTPAAIRDAYREAFTKSVTDPEFNTLAEQLIPGFTAIPAEETEKIIRELATASDETYGVMNKLMRKQGINVSSNRARE